MSEDQVAVCEGELCLPECPTMLEKANNRDNNLALKNYICLSSANIKEGVLYLTYNAQAALLVALNSDPVHPSQHTLCGQA